MTPEEIIEMARQAGIHYREIPGEFATANGDGVENEQMEEFAKLVAAKEREACANHVKHLRNGDDYGEFLAKAIRVRGET